MNINTFEYKGTLYSLLGYSGGRSLVEEIEKNYARTGSGQNDGCLRCLLRVIKGALDALQVFHSSGYLHLDISPDNILLIGRGDRERVILIDYNSVYTLEEAVKSQGFRVSGFKRDL